ncbi:hypothetical protein HDU98_012352 [Podochytrium sp. JEL0797]|nr:hypothetical protein HDU98_012352 [Podochytrium sp. JEL0797]
MTAVDYLSHNFNEFDLHQCWRNATKNKDSLINGRRLENASWRKFFQMKFTLQTISPASLNWNKDGDVNWLYGPFHTYEPLLQLQAAYRAAAQQLPFCGDAACPGACAACTAHAASAPHPHHSHLKPAIKNFAAPQQQQQTSIPLPAPGVLPRAASDPDLFSSAAQAQKNMSQNNTPRHADFGATKESIRSNFERQQAIAPLSGKKADFFLASAAERERRLKMGNALARSTSEADSMDSFASDSMPNTPPAKTIRFAVEPAVVVPVAPPVRKTVISFVDDDDDDEEDDDEEEDVEPAVTVGPTMKEAFAHALTDDESDLLVSQVQRTRDMSDEDDDSSSDDDADFGINIRSTRSLAAKGIQVTSSTSTTTASTYTHSSSIGLQRTPSAEKGLSKLSSLSGAVSSNPSTSSGASSGGGFGGMQRTASFEKGLSKLSSLSKP